MARDEEETQIEVLSEVWGSEPPSRGRNAPFAWERKRRLAASPRRTPAPSPPRPSSGGKSLPREDQLIGMKLGEYELRSRIGVGGMGIVYAASSRSSASAWR